MKDTIKEVAVHLFYKKGYFVTSIIQIAQRSGIIKAIIYHHYTKVEIFFKWIKQHLRIKAFYGSSENAVKTQIWITISVNVLVAIIKKHLKIDLSLYTIL